ncbi:Ig-like domain-containing protein [Aquimarina rubra]|uniref:DUF1573 domain-containing protein n=1 Tax=Aquimarina rubra TaxID=1920033 RepID=A0ABW5L9E7_9FLAO
MKILLKSFLYLFLSLFLYSCGSSDSSDEVITIEEEEDPDPIATITITVVDDVSLDFGEVVENITQTKTFKISNSGNVPLEITEIKVPDGFSLDWISGSIAAGSFRDVNLSFMPNGISDFGGEIIIESNATSGNNKVNCLGVGISDIYEGDLLLASQIEIENFVNKGYKEVTGQLFIAFESGFPNRNTTIVSLEPLSQLRSINTIRINSTANLKSLNGLEDVEIKGSVALFDNVGLENIDGLVNIVDLNGFLQIAGCSSLTNLSALANLVSVKSVLTITYNDLLENLNGLSSLKMIGGNLEIKNNPFVNTLEGLNNLENIGGNLSVSYNERLNDFCAIKNLLVSNGLDGTFFETRYNKYNPSKLDITDGDCFKDFPQGVYGGNLVIRSKGAYETFISMNYEGIDGDLTINNNRDSDIMSLEDLSGLKRVLGNLYINRMIIEDLQGLGNLELVEGNLQISDNPNLSDFCEIQGLLQNNGVGSFFTSGNVYNPSAQEIVEETCSN